MLVGFALFSWSNLQAQVELESDASLSEKYGSPLYVYDAEKIISQYNRITSAFASVKSLKLNYAVIYLNHYP